MTILPKIPRPPSREATRIISPGGHAIILGTTLAPTGGWHHVILDGKPVPVAYCPKCHKEGYLDDHTVAVDGTVDPSVKCPHEPCDFHDTVRLDGWEP